MPHAVEASGDAESLVSPGGRTTPIETPPRSLADLIGPDAVTGSDDSPITHDSAEMSVASVTVAKSAAPSLSQRAVLVSNHGPRLERVPPLSIRPAPMMSRRHIDTADLKALTRSIERNGMAQPLLARVSAAVPDMLELVAGYRRWRAALVANVAYVPVIVFPNLGDAVALELGLLENLHRRELTTLEEAETLRMLTDQYGRTHEQIAALTNRSRSQVTNMLRLLGLPEPVKEIMHTGRISIGHARALLKASEPAALAQRIISERLTVRETESLVSTTQTRGEPSGDSAQTARHGEPMPSAVPVSQPAPLLRELRLLKAELSLCLGVQLDMGIGADNTAMLIRAGSSEEVVRVVNALRDGLRLLRLNRILATVSPEARAS